MRPLARGGRASAIAALARMPSATASRSPLARRRGARGPGRVDHRSGRLHARRWRRRPSATAPTIRTGFRRHRPRATAPGLGCRALAASGSSAPSRSTAPASAPAASPGSPVTRASTSTRARASSSSSTRPAASRSSRSCCRCRARAPRGSSFSPPSTARWSRARPPSTRRTTMIGRCDPMRAMRSCRRRSPMHPPLADPEPIASYAGLRPAGRDGANYVIGPPPACDKLINAGGDPLDRAHRFARHRRAGRASWSASRRPRSAPELELSPARCLRRPARGGDAR